MDISHLLELHFTNGPVLPGWGMLELGAGNVIRVFHMWQGIQVSWLPLKVCMNRKLVLGAELGLHPKHSNRACRVFNRHLVGCSPDTTACKNTALSLPLIWLGCPIQASLKFQVWEPFGTPCTPG